MRVVTTLLVCFLAACATAQATTGSRPAEPSEVAGTVPATSADAAAPEAPAERRCDTQHLWDAQASACRLYPGGGNGWAGCSIQPGPPRGEACFTGTHWEQRGCDCVCDRTGESWDASSMRCR